MASDRHTLFGGALVAVVAAAIIAGFVVSGGPGEARKQKIDQARLEALWNTSLSLACYRQEVGELPSNLDEVEEELSHAASAAHGPQMCQRVDYKRDPVSGEHFRLVEENGTISICADFATRGGEPNARFYTYGSNVAPDLSEERDGPGEHCFELNLDADLD